MPLDSDLKKKIRQEVEGGLSTDSERRDDALKNLQFFNGDFKSYKPKTTNTTGDELRPRYSLLMQKVVKTLCGNLYKTGPKRTILEHEEASKWLEWIYRCNPMNALWQRADIASTWGDWCAFQVRPLANPLKPIDILLWDASQLYVWCDPEDQRTPVAIGTRDAWNEQSRLRVWTAETITTYLTRELVKGKQGQTSGGTAFIFKKEETNPLQMSDGTGILPFSFVHYDMPVQEFDTTGPGDFLACVNENVNSILTNIGGAITYNLWPVVVVDSAPIGWRPPTPHKPGAVWYTEVNPALEGQGAKMTVNYLQADSSYVASGWEDLTEYTNHTFDCCGIPQAAIRMEQTSTQSGAAIVAEQIPLILWAQSRQEPFSYYERSLAQLVLNVASSHLASQTVDEYRVRGPQLEEAAYDPQLMLRWPSMYPRIPGQERDLSDSWELDNGFTSITAKLMERESLTREEAEAKLEEIAKDRKREHQLFGDLLPAQADANKVAEEEAKKVAEEDAAADAKDKPEDGETPESKGNGTGSGNE